MSTSFSQQSDPTAEYDTITLPITASTSPSSTDDNECPGHAAMPRPPWRSAWSHAKENVVLIKTAPRELWVIFLLKFFSSYAYFSMSLVLTLFLSQDFALSDMDAGWVFGMYGVMSTFYGIVCGWVIDFLGIRLSLLFGGIVGVFCRTFIVLSSSRVIALTLLLGVLPFGEALGIPIMTIAIKRYTNRSNRTFAFSLFYSVMNVAALLAGPVVDGFRSLFSGGYDVTLPTIGGEHVFHLSALRLVLLTGSIASFCLIVITYFAVRDVELDHNGRISAFSPNRTNPLQSTWLTLQDRAFWRLLVLTVLLIGVRLVFSHNSATMPKYLIRQFGRDAPFGLVYAINPFLIIFLVPLVGIFTKNVSSFPMILYGSFVAAASPFFICIDQTYLMVVLYMVTLSLGEAIYSPRVYEYSLELSRRGSEGIYSSLSTAPLFSVALLVGGQSGWLLSTFMAPNGPRNGKMLWGIIGITCMTSPILMFIFRDFIGKEDQPGNEVSETPALPVTSSQVSELKDGLLTA